MRKNNAPLPKAILLGLLLLLGSILLSSCGTRKNQLIGRYGLAYAQLGDEMPSPGLRSLKKYPAYDSLIDSEDFSWRVTCLEYKKGMVYLEEDFWGSEMINRIRITTPELHLKNGLRVGSTLRELLGSWEEWFIVPLPEFQLFDFYSRLYPRIHFLIPDPGVSLEKTDIEDYSPQEFNPEATVKWIVVF